jgi:predicted lactoylglutathione lyase
LSSGNSNEAVACRSTRRRTELAKVLALIVSDIDEVSELLQASGLAAAAEPTRSDHVDTVMIKDPDGNSVAFAMPKDQTLAH